MFTEGGVKVKWQSKVVPVLFFFLLRTTPWRCTGGVDLGTRWRWVVSFTPRPLPQGKSPWYPLDRRLGGPQSRSWRAGEKKNSHPCRDLNPRYSSS